MDLLCSFFIRPIGMLSCGLMPMAYPLTMCTLVQKRKMFPKRHQSHPSIKRRPRRWQCVLPDRKSPVGYYILLASGCWNWQQDKLQRRRLVFPNTTHNPYETLDTVCNYAMYAWVPFSNADRGSEWFGYASKLLVNCKPVFTEIWIKIRLNMSPKCIQLSLTLSGCLFCQRGGLCRLIMYL